MLATAASSSSGRSAKMRIAASRNVSTVPRLHSVLPTRPVRALSPQSRVK
jgi:hypothetical protein